MHDLAGATVTTRGTRPGDPVADILFNMPFRLVVLDARSRILDASALVWFGAPQPAADVTAVEDFPANGFAEISFVDDIAYATQFTSADKLVHDLQIV